MIGKKKLFAAVFAGLFIAMFVVGVFALRDPYIIDSIISTDFAGSQKEEPSVEINSAYSMPSVGSRWWDYYSSSSKSTTSSGFSTLMSISCYLPHAGHLEVRVTLEYAVTSSDNCEVRCTAVKGTTTYYARPGYYWLGRGAHATSRIWETRAFTFLFENLAAGTYTVNFQWRSMISGHTTSADERTMIVTWYMYP